MLLGAKDVEAAEGNDEVVLFLPAVHDGGPGLLQEVRGGGVQGVTGAAKFFCEEAVRVAAEDDVGAAAGHVGGDGDRATLPGLGDDDSLMLVLLGVEDLVGMPRFLSRSATRSEFSMDVVPTRTGCPALWRSWISLRRPATCRPPTCRRSPWRLPGPCARGWGW